MAANSNFADDRLVVPVRRIASGVQHASMDDAGAFCYGFASLFPRLPYASLPTESS